MESKYGDPDSSLQQDDIDLDGADTEDLSPPEPSNQLEAIAAFPRAVALCEQKDFKEAIPLLEVIRRFHYSPAIQLLWLCEMKTGNKSFVQCVAEMLDYFELDHDKVRKKYVDYHFIETFFELALSMNLFSPLPTDSIPEKYRHLSSEDLLIVMTAIKGTLHLHAEILSAFYLALQK